MGTAGSHVAGSGRIHVWEVKGVSILHCLSPYPFNAANMHVLWRPANRGGGIATDLLSILGGEYSHCVLDVAGGSQN